MRRKLVLLLAVLCVPETGFAQVPPAVPAAQPTGTTPQTPAPPIAVPLVPAAPVRPQPPVVHQFDPKHLEVAMWRIGGC